MLLCKGRIVYVGRLDKVEKYLNEAGFERPDKKALPQFLEELSSKPEHFYTASPSKQPSTHKPPTSHNHSRSQSPKQRSASPNVNSVGERGRAQDSQRHHSSDAQRGATEPNSPTASQQRALEEGRAKGGREQDTAAAAAAAVSSSGAHQQTSSDKAEQSGNHGTGQGAGQEPKKEAGGDDDSPTRVALNKLLEAWQGSKAAKQNVEQAELDSHERSSDHSPQPGDESGKQASGARQPQQSPNGNNGDKGLQTQPPRNGPSTSHASPPQQSTQPDSALTAASKQQQQQQQQQPAHVSFLLRGWYRYYNSSPLLQFQQNLHRHALLTFRNTGLWRDIWILAALIGIVIGSLFYQLGVDEVGVRNRLGLYFYIISYLGFNAVQLVPVLASQRTVLSNETRSGYYHHFAYFFSLLLVQLPIVLVEALLVLTPVWGLSWLQGMDWGGRFWFAYLVISLTSYTSRAFMFTVYGLSPNEAYADVLNQVCNIIFTKLCGYFIPQQEIVDGWHWVYYLSYFTFAFRALALNDILPIQRDCTPTPQATCLFTSGAGALEILYTMDPGWSKWLQVEYLFDFFLTFSAIGFAAMWQIDWAVTEDWEVPYFQSKQEIEEERRQSEDAASDDSGGDDRDKKKQQSEEAQAGSNKSPRRVQAGGGGKAPLNRTHSDIVIIDGGSTEQQQQEEDESEQADLEAQRSYVTGHRPRPRSFHYQHRIRRLEPSPETKRRQATKHQHDDERQSDHEQQRRQQETNKGKDNGKDSQQGSAEEKTAALEKKKSNGVTMEFYKLNYSVDVKGGKQRRLLHDVFGYCTPGMMVALMGATGAGKVRTLTPRAHASSRTQHVSQLPTRLSSLLTSHPLCCLRSLRAVL